MSNKCLQWVQVGNWFLETNKVPIKISLTVLQDAMARYYGEQGTQYDTEYRKVKNRTEANTLLQRNFWLGQEQGRGSNLTHSRHLRPLCEPVSSGQRDPIQTTEERTQSDIEDRPR